MECILFSLADGGNITAVDVVGQTLDDVEGTVAGSTMQRRAAMVVACVDVGPKLQEKVDASQASRSCGKVQRCLLRIGDCIHLDGVAQ